MVSYFEYRRRLKEIAMESWRKVSEVVFHGPWDQFVKLISKDQVVVPTDDDDWFAPQLRNRLLELEDGMLCWQSLCHQTTMAHKLYYRRRKLGSNEYAATGSLLKKLNNPERFLHAHGKADVIAQRFGSVQRSSEVLSCYNWHPGSASILSNTHPANLKSLFPDHLKDGFPELASHPWMIQNFEEFCEVVKLPCSIKLM